MFRYLVFRLRFYLYLGKKMSIFISISTSTICIYSQIYTYTCTYMCVYIYILLFQLPFFQLPESKLLLQHRNKAYLQIDRYFWKHGQFDYSETRVCTFLQVDLVDKMVLPLSSVVYLLLPI